MNILITGGAGYIGSHMARMLSKYDHSVEVIDSMENGHRSALPVKVVITVANISDKKALDTIFSATPIDAVIHFAGYINVEESVRDPYKYFSNNVLNSMNLLEVMEAHGVNKIIFSSTAAIYGTPQTEKLAENHSKLPTSPYGLSKWNFEELLRYFDQKGTIRSISLRYFNAAGASLDGENGEDHAPESHIIPLALKTASGKQKEFYLFGTQYPTRDGSCIRDYIHVEDLCRAHLLMLEALAAGHGTDAYNVGTGDGVSNREVVGVVKKVTGVDFSVVESDPRPGDPHTLVADVTRLQSEFGWKPIHSDIKSIVESAWKWTSGHPNGYEDRH
ncbi:UDP-glucose 4-epimerase GalE [Candidatus Gottesmanbacteria bacterium]|nr:UDP-glucose 4-epimerase GalE [Candidatus Gottesmanbacteria bacterium]